MGVLIVMDQSDQLQNVLPGQASQPQGGPHPQHLAEAAKAADHAADEPTAESVVAPAEIASAEPLDTAAKHKQQDGVEAAIEPKLEPLPLAASTVPPEATFCQPAVSPAESSTQQTEAPASDLVEPERRWAEPVQSDLAAAQVAAAHEAPADVAPAREAPGNIAASDEAVADVIAADVTAADSAAVGATAPAKSNVQVEQMPAAQPAVVEAVTVAGPGAAVESPTAAPAAGAAIESATMERSAESHLVAEEPAVATQQPSQPPTEAPAEEKSKNMQWYVLKVQSNREETIREALLKRVKIAGLEKYFGEIIIPTEKVTEVKGGKKRVVTRKLYPGYLVAQMEINDDTWYLVRDTSGIGDFTGAAGRPSPMPEHEVARILAKHEEKSQKQPKLKIAFKPGDQVKIHEGTFENFEGQVESIDETNGRVTVMINIFGRSTPVELEYWQIGAV